MGGSSAIYSAYYVGLGLRSRLEEDRRHRAFEFLALLNRPEFIKVRKFIEEEIQNPDQVAEKDLYSTVVSNFGLHVAIREVLGTFEDMALAIQFEHFDEDVLHRSVSVISDRHYVHLAFYIRQHRLEFDSPKLFCEFEALCNSWRKGRRLSDGKSF